MKKKQTHQRAFTLAELLITIGIIGVVAALTIPTLVNNYQTRSWNISSSNFEAKFGEALKIMNTQQSLSHLGTTERFVNELQKHMKITKVCNNEELTLCFPDEINGSTSIVDITDESTYSNDYTKPTQTKTIKTAKELGQNDWNTNTMGVQFANGVSAILAYNPKCSANPFDVNAVTVSGDKENITFGTDCVAMVYDTSSYANPNELHKDIHISSMATVDNSGGCMFKIGSACITNKLSVPPSISRTECRELQKDLGINYCSINNDYWAGAAKTCGGKSKIVNSEELRQIASFIYGTEVSLRGTTNGSYDSSNATKIGFPNSAESVFYVWGNYELDGYYTRNRTFRATSTYGEGPDTPDSRSNSATLVLCKE